MIVSHDLTILAMIVNASIVVKFVMAVLVLASLFSWTYIFMKIFALRRAHKPRRRPSSASSGAAPTWSASTSAPRAGATSRRAWSASSRRASRSS